MCAALVGAIGASGCSSPQPTNPIIGSLTATWAVSQVNPGDTAVAVIGTPGNVTGDQLVVQLAVDGEASKPDSVTIPVEHGPLYLELPIPDGFPDVTITVTAWIPKVNLTATATLVVKDTRPPTISTTLGTNGLPFNIAMAPLAPMLLTGTTDTLTMSITDNGAIAVYGYSIGAPVNMQDSTVVENVLTASATVAVPIQTGWLGGTPAVTVFARDRDGNTTTIPLGKVAIASHVTHPVTTVALDPTVERAVYDSKRNKVYFAVRDQAAVQVLDLSSFTFVSSLPLPKPAVDLDLRPGGDSLIVGLGGTADLSILNLATPGAPTTVHVNAVDATPGDTASGGAIEQLRVAGDGTAIIWACCSQLAEFNAITATDTLVSLLYVAPVFGRSASGSTVFLAPSSSSTQMLVYQASSHAFSYMGSIPSGTQTGQASGSSDGSLNGMGDGVYDAAFNFLGTADVSPTPSTTPPSVVSSAGNAFYVGVPPSYYVRFQEPIKVNDSASSIVGQPIEVVDAPEQITQFVQTTDTSSVLALGADKVMRFDLTQSSPAAARAVKALRATAAAHRGKVPVAPPQSGAVATGTLPTLHLRLKPRSYH